MKVSSLKNVFSARHVRRVPGDRAPGPAATQRGTTPSQATGPAESPAEQVLCRHQRGEDPNKSTQGPLEGWMVQEELLMTLVT